MNISDYIQTLAQNARSAAKILAASSTQQKNTALKAIADNINDQTAKILAANELDLEKGQAANLDSALMDRLALNPNRLIAMIDSLLQVADLSDPVGRMTDLQPRPSGIQVGKMRVPLGVVGIIYESRPNVTSEAASLCLKSGNATILRGGSEAIASNQAIAGCIQAGLESAGLPQDAVQVINTTDRAAVGSLIQSTEYLDVLIPRGGKNLIERISQEARIPVIKHLEGNCHIYIDKYAAVETAVAITVNAKTQRFGTCNTTESLLIHDTLLATVLPQLEQAMTAHQIEFRACDQALLHLKNATAATEADWSMEYLGPILSIKAVSGLDEAIAHINQYGSGHTDCIITNHHQHVMDFMRQVDSSSVMVNASTRFADGFEYGLGAEVGISTDKFHARGPVGLEGLTSEKYVVFGQGNLRT